MNIVDAVLLCFLLAALIRAPLETAAPRAAVAAMYLLLIVGLCYLLLHGRVR